MIEELQLRITENKDWATILFFLVFGIIALTKSTYENRFAEFSKLLFSDKYIKIHKDSNQLKSGFTLSLFLVQILSFAFFILLTLSIFNLASKTNWVLYIQIVTFLIFFILSKYLIEKIIAIAFNIEEFIDQFNLQKVTYRSYLAILILPFNVILFYHDTISKNIPLIIIGISLAISTVAYFISIKNYQNTILNKLFYFILYLCTLEIAPYYFMYFWFTKTTI